MATPASAPPKRSPMRLTVARIPSSETPRSTSGGPACSAAPSRAASRAHCRQLAAGTDRLVKIRTSAVPARLAARSASVPAWRSAGRGGADRPGDPGPAAPAPDADPGTVCRAASPARSSARSRIDRVHSPRSPPPALRSTSAASSRAAASEGAGVCWASAVRQHAASRRRPASPATSAPERLAHVRFRGGNMSAFSTAGSRSSRRPPAARGASPTAPTTARSGCSRSSARSPAPAGSSASGTATSA